ncbi:MAG: nicotinate phosphoribosyltransferase [Propionibacteriaceae bacterium]|jgi:nicotinate phosphoribosyltransferase|nr:nicotinate phosphoribosyltransferase [Propionibacteriaceae bacterium]
MTTALKTDHYELTMVQASWASGLAQRRSVFELFTRKLPEGRRYGVCVGAGRLLDALEEFRFDSSTIDFLTSHNVVDSPLAAWLSEFRFGGNIWGYPDGELYFPGSPLLIVEGSFAEACILETLALSIYNYDSAVASAASRMTLMAGNRPCIEMGSRRANEYAAVAAARAAYIAGFGSTSNLEAGFRYGVPTAGTAAHSFTLLHDTERDAYVNQLATLGEKTTLLVDTYNIDEAIRTGVELTDGRLGAIRIDSGDLFEAAIHARTLLDELGAVNTRIIVTSDLDEFQIAALRAAPVDGYGVGTSLVTGSGAPTSFMVYKLVSREGESGEMVSVAKASSGKATVGGRKFALRRLNDNGRATAEVIGVGAMPEGDSNDRELLVPLVLDGEIVGREPLAAARERHTAALAELPLDARKMSKGDPAIETIYLDEQGNPPAGFDTGAPKER